ncbi:MAG: nickel-dependent lactate racemase, partial [Desulfobacterales bacterium]|jgi:nickel-dependent lactate racemase|nr:nickel-dependent lactate racemase [Desulfobacterales bacterium]
MRVELLYGRGRLAVDFPENLNVTTIRKQPMPVAADPAERLRASFRRTASGRPLRELASERRTACILICDITRPVPHGTLLPPLIDELTAGGMSADNILILVATGLHRPNEGAELREVVGSDAVIRQVRVANHFARDRDAHADLGRTPSGIPIRLDRRFVDAELRIVVGLVEPHFMAGYSGGRKLVVPGVAHSDTILKLHAGVILDHARAANAVIEGNPLHQEQLNMLRAVGEIFALNVVIDEERRIGFVNFGLIEESHLEAVAFTRPYAEVSVPRRFKTVVTTSAGYPLDKTYYQTIKGMVGVLDIVEPGGTIIIASECSEGVGSPEFVEAQRALCRMGPDRFMADVIARNHARIDEWQTQMLVKALRKGRVKLYTTGLRPSDLDKIFVDPVASVAAAATESVNEHQDPGVAVVPEGPYVIPVFRPN